MKNYEEFIQALPKEKQASASYAFRRGFIDGVLFDKAPAEQPEQPEQPNSTYEESLGGLGAVEEFPWPVEMDYDAVRALYAQDFVDDNYFYSIHVINR